MTANRNDPAEQIIACLDVLWEELQHRIGDDQGEAPVRPSEEELTTALWQLPELVFSMAGELDHVYTLLEQIAFAQQAQHAQRERVASIILPNR